MKIAFCVAERQQQRFPNAALPVYTLCQTIASLRRLSLREGEKYIYSKYIIIKGNCKLKSLNMGLERKAKHRRQQGVIILVFEASRIPPTPLVPH